MRNATTSIALYKGNILPSPAQYEEGDLYLLVPTGELYVRNAGNWLLVGGGGSVTNGANIGGGPGEVFDQKVGTILQFRTLESPDNTIQIVTTGGTVQVQLDPTVAAVIAGAVQGGVNRGTGLEVFATLVGNYMEFRTINSAGGGVDLLAGQDADHVYLASLTSSDGSVNITKSSTEVDLTAGLGFIYGPSGDAARSIISPPVNLGPLSATPTGGYANNTSPSADTTVTSPSKWSLLFIRGRITLSGNVNWTGATALSLYGRLTGGFSQFAVPTLLRQSSNIIHSGDILLGNLLVSGTQDISITLRLPTFASLIAPNTDFQLFATLINGELVSPPSPQVNEFARYEFWIGGIGGGTVNINNITCIADVKWSFVELG